MVVSEDGKCQDATRQEVLAQLTKEFTQVQTGKERLEKTMHKRMAVTAICIAAFAISAAGQTGTVTLDAGTPPSGLTNSNITELNGNVGIGTPSPWYNLDVYGTQARGLHLTANGSDTGAYLNTGGLSAAYLSGGATYLNFGGGTYNYIAKAATASGIVFENGGTTLWTNTGLTIGSTFVYSPTLTINSGGNVGIGTTSPGAKLEVNGGLRFSADPRGTVQTTAWTGTLCGGDYAESVDVTGDRKHYEPGDVLVLDTDNPGKVLKSIEPYSTAVSGIYSTKPGTVGRRQTAPKSPDEVPMAVVGIVPAKVSAENGPVKVGDLLVTSSTPGYAMKGTDRSRMLGAVVGKAMAKLDSGRGVIEVLVTLQ